MLAEACPQVLDFQVCPSVWELLFCFVVWFVIGFDTELESFHNHNLICAGKCSGFSAPANGASSYLPWTTTTTMADCLRKKQMDHLNKFNMRQYFSFRRVIYA